MFAFMLFAAIVPQDPCIERVPANGDKPALIRRLPPRDCAAFDPEARIEGLWFVGFEISAFVPIERLVDGEIVEGPSTWLAQDSQTDRSAEGYPECFRNYRAYRVEVTGRFASAEKPKLEGYGHFSMYNRLFLVDAFHSVDPYELKE